MRSTRSTGLVFLWVLRPEATNTQPAPRSAWRMHLLALVCYSLCAVVVTYPLVTRLDSAFIANEFGQVDGFLSIWNLWWAAQAIQHGQSPFHTPLLFYPQGLDLFWLWLSFPNGVVAFPLTTLAGPLIAYNITILAGYIFGGYTAFLFVRHVCRDTAAALVAGAIYTLTPFHMRRVLDAVMDTASIQWVPLYLLVLHLLLERRRWYWALLAGFLVFVVGLGSWYYGLFCLIYTGMATALWSVKTPAPGTSNTAPLIARFGRLLDLRTFAWGLAPIVIWLVLVAPQLVSLIQTGDRVLGVGRDANDSNSADLISFWLPNPFHPLWGQAITNFYTQLRPEAWLWQISFGTIALLLALLGVRQSWRANWRWATLLLGTMLLAMGERLSIFGIKTAIPLPYALLAGLPGIRTSHRPNHIILISTLLLALLAAYGVIILFRRWPRLRLPLSGGLIAAVLLIDGWAGPLPLYSFPIPAAYSTALPKPDDGAILPVPVNLNVARSEQLWYQTAHGWPIIGGYTGREPPYPLGRYAPGIRELRYGRYEADDIVTPGWPEQAREMLAALNIRYVTFHPDLMRASLEPQHALIAAMGLAPSYSDERLEVYPVPEVEQPRPLAYLGAGWGGVERDGARRWRWMGERAELYLINPHETAREIVLDLHLESFEHERPLSISLNGMPPVTLAVSRAEMRRSIRLLLEPGRHVVYFSAPANPPEGRSGPLRSISFLGITIRD